MKSIKKYIALSGIILAVASSHAFADEGSGSLTGTGPTGPRPGIMPAIHQEKRDDRQEIRDKRQEGKQGVKAQCQELKDENKENRDQMKANHDSMRLEVGMLKNYLKSPLTEAEKKVIGDLWKKHTDDGKTILAGSGTNTEKIASLKASLTTFLAAVKPYVASDKTAAYDTFVTERLSKFDANMPLRMENKDNRQECTYERKEMKEDIKLKAQQIKKVLSENMKNTLNAKFDSIPAADRTIFYTKLIARIDVLLTQPRSERVKDMLREIKAIAQDRLVALQPLATEESVVNEVLNPTVTQ